MKKVVLYVLMIGLVYACGTSKRLITIKNVPIIASLDLIHIKNDKVEVSVNPGAFVMNNVTFKIPMTVPGTYSADNYGKYIQDFIALDYEGKVLDVNKTDQNTWVVPEGKKLDRITYWVNDTYDTENELEEPVFSPAGTNISEGENFILNLHGFVGYFEGFKEIPYTLLIHKPADLVGVTTLPLEPNRKPDPLWDGYVANRYFEVIDNPILYAKPNKEVFQIKDIRVTLGVYSPNGVYAASDLRERMEEMMIAQKAFLGDVDSTKEYAILLYLSDLDKSDAAGFGALEHNTSAVVVLPEALPKERLEQAMVDVVSHEFFHIVTPLTIHSKEIQFFDFNNPKMSKHLWMYEGTTEYFANLFQIQQGLIKESEFYKRIMDKVAYAKSFDDTMSFTRMSANILDEPYEDNYANVYEKGALINMALDILIREKSEGERGVLWLMKELSKKYGKDTPFEDDMLIDEIVALTYLEVGVFFNKHVIGNQPIDYSEYFAKVGLAMIQEDIQTGYFLDEQTAFIDVNDEEENTVFVRDNINLNSFFINLGLQGGDVFRTFNGEEVTLESMREIVADSYAWSPDTKVEIEVIRNKQVIKLAGLVGLPTLKIDKIVALEAVSADFANLRNAWLKE